MTKPAQIYHSKLTQMLNDFENTPPRLLKAYIGKVIAETRGGVAPEGGELIATDSVLSAGQVRVVRQPTGFIFSDKSRKELVGVDTRLVDCVSLALGYYTKIDFMVFDGIRSLEEQKRHVANGTSKTLKSKHLDGLAVDLVPIIGGVPKWDWVGCYEVAYAMDAAATELGIADLITWGGAWDKTLADFGGSATAYADEVQKYRARHAGSDFIDGPHFEIRK